MWGLFFDRRIDAFQIERWSSERFSLFKAIGKLMRKHTQNRLIGSRKKPLTAEVSNYTVLMSVITGSVREKLCPECNLMQT
jgi:hypothetical protein